MNKLTVFVLVALIAAIILLSGCIQQDQQVSDENKSQTTKGKCGDGICGPVEKEKGTCPEDCGTGSGGASTGGTAKSKCGDGVCGEKEKADPSLCPEDCQES